MKRGMSERELTERDLVTSTGRTDDPAEDFHSCPVSRSRESAIGVMRRKSSEETKIR